MCKTVLEKYNEFGDSKVKEDKDVLDDFVKTEYLSDFLQELPYDVAIKHQQALQKYGNLFVRNSFKTSCSSLPYFAVPGTPFLLI